MPTSENGQGQNRTADTMIFSHVLYQLSYLAQTKNPPNPLEGEGGKSSEKPMLRRLRSRPPSRAPGISDRPDTRCQQCISSGHPNVGNAARRRRFASHSGGRIRTCDLRVMSPTSYQTAPPRNRDEEVIRPANRRSTRLTGSNGTHRGRAFIGEHRRMRPLSLARHLPFSGLFSPPGVEGAPARVYLWLPSGRGAAR